MGKVNYIKVKPELGKTEEEKEELKNKAEEVNKKVDEKINERVKQGKIEKTSPDDTGKDKPPKTNNIKMTDDEKKTAALEYFKNNYVIDDNSVIPAIDVFNKMKEETGLKLLSFKFMQYLREDNIRLIKEDKFYITGYKRKE